MIYLNNIEKTIHKPQSGALDSVGEDAVKALAAGLFNVKKPENIYLTAGGSQTVETALRSFVREGDRVITVQLQEDAAQMLQDLGAVVFALPLGAYLQPDYDSLPALLDAGAKAVVCSHGSRATGNVVDLERICAMARARHIPVIADGRSACGAIEVNLEVSGAEVYCFTGESMLMGPSGIGGICVKESVDVQPLMACIAEMPADAFALPDKILTAFAASLKFILDKGIYGIAMLPHRLAKRFYESSKAMDGVTVHGDYSQADRLPVVAITAEGFTAEEICEYMKSRDILIGVEDGMARFSFGYFNTRPQVKETVQRLMDMLGIDDPYLLP